MIVCLLGICGSRDLDLEEQSEVLLALYDQLLYEALHLVSTKGHPALGLYVLR